jgi:hypothetical protein
VKLNILIVESLSPTFDLSVLQDLLAKREGARPKIICGRVAVGPSANRFASSRTDDQARHST